jgi:transposase
LRYEFSDYEWAAIKPMLPNKPRGVPRVNDRRVLNGIFRVLRSGAPWRDLPAAFGPYTTCYDRFVVSSSCGLTCSNQGADMARKPHRADAYNAAILAAAVRYDVAQNLTAAT